MEQQARTTITSPVLRRTEVTIPAPSQITVTGTEFAPSAVAGPSLQQLQATRVLPGVEIQRSRVTPSTQRVSLAPVIRAPTLRTTEQPTTLGVVITSPRRVKVERPVSPVRARKMAAAATVAVQNAQDLFTNADKQLENIQNQLRRPEISDDQRFILQQKSRSLTQARDAAKVKYDQGKIEIDRLKADYDKQRQKLAGISTEIESAIRKSSEKRAAWQSASTEEDRLRLSADLDAIDKELIDLNALRDEVQTSAFSSQSAAFDKSIILNDQVSTAYVGASVEAHAETLREIDRELERWKAEKNELQVQKWTRFRDYVGQVRDNASAAELDRAFLLISSMTEQLSALNDQKQDLTSRLQQVTAAQNLTAEENATAKVENDRLKRQIADLQDQIAKSTGPVASPEEGQLRQQVQQLRANLASRQQQLETVQKQLEEARAARTEAEALTQQQTSQQAQTTQLVDRIASILRQPDIANRQLQLTSLVSELQTAGVSPSLISVLRGISSDLTTFQNVQAELERVKAAAAATQRSLQNQLVQAQQKEQTALTSEQVIQQAINLDQTTRKDLVKRLGYEPLTPQEVEASRRRTERLEASKRELDDVVGVLRQTLGEQVSADATVQQLLSAYQTKLAKKAEGDMEKVQRDTIEGFAEALRTVLGTGIDIPVAQDLRGAIASIQAQVSSTLRDRVRTAAASNDVRVKAMADQMDAFVSQANRIYSGQNFKTVEDVHAYLQQKAVKDAQDARQMEQIRRQDAESARVTLQLYRDLQGWLQPLLKPGQVLDKQVVQQAVDTALGAPLLQQKLTSSSEQLSKAMRQISDLQKTANAVAANDTIITNLRGTLQTVVQALDPNRTVVVDPSDANALRSIVRQITGLQATVTDLKTQNAQLAKRPTVDLSADLAVARSTIQKLTQDLDRASQDRTAALKKATDADQLASKQKEVVAALKQLQEQTKAQLDQVKTDLLEAEDSAQKMASDLQQNFATIQDLRTDLVLANDKAASAVQPKTKARADKTVKGLSEYVSDLYGKLVETDNTFAKRLEPILNRLQSGKPADIKNALQQIQHLQEDLQRKAEKDAAILIGRTEAERQKNAIEAAATGLGIRTTLK